MISFPKAKLIRGVFIITLCLVAYGIWFMKGALERGRMVTHCSYANQLISLIHLYSDKHDQQFPNDLHDLVVDGICEESIFRLLSFYSTPDEWLYSGRGHTVGGHTLLLSSPRPLWNPSDENYIVIECFSDTGAEVKVGGKRGKRGQ